MIITENRPVAERKTELLNDSITFFTNEFDQKKLFRVPVSQ